VTALYPQKLALKSAAQWQSLSIFHLWTKCHGVFFFFLVNVPELEYSSTISLYMKKLNTNSRLIVTGKIFRIVLSGGK
jgi:hypothetical protein